MELAGTAKKLQKNEDADNDEKKKKGEEENVKMKSMEEKDPPASGNIGEGLSEKRTGKKKKDPNLSNSSETYKRGDEIMENVKKKLKVQLKEKFTRIYEGTAASRSRLEQVYTNLYITTLPEDYGCRSHEILYQFKVSSERSPCPFYEPIDILDIFKQQHEKDRAIKRIMTKGIAGIGKTVAVQNFTLGWAQGKSNQHIDFIFMLPFRELNLLKEGEYSLLQLLFHFYPELKQIENSHKLVDMQVLFIFDGLDESRFLLDFDGSRTVTDLDQKSTVDVLLTNLITGNLLPNALVWMTSRPAAASQIPPEYVDQMTEVQGFTDQQKEEYFAKRFRKPREAIEFKSFLRGMISFHFMGHIPIFCWITSEVFRKGWNDQNSRMITTMTELYVNYLRIQTQLTTWKYEEKKPAKNIFGSQNAATISKLSKLAFEQLEKGNIIFYEEDLIECGINVHKASLFCGLCSEILQQECGLYQKRMFSFVHLSFQEFLAALYMFLCCVTKNITALKFFLEVDPTDLSFLELLKRIVDKALQNEKGQLDLFLCFFLGLLLESNQTMLQGLVPQTKNMSETVEEMKKYLQSFHAGNIQPERCMNLFLCKFELKEQNIVKEIQKLLHSGVRLSPIDCGVLSALLQISGELIDELDLTKCSTPYTRSEKLLLPMKNCKRAVLKIAHVQDSCLAVLVSILQSPDSCLRELSVESCSNVEGPPPDDLLAALGSPHCKLEMLSLSGFALEYRFCHMLVTILQSKQSPLRALNLTYCLYSYPQDYSGYFSKEEGKKETYKDVNDDLSLLTIIPSALISPVCKVKELRMIGCLLTSKCCQVFASVLSSNSELRVLDLSRNNLQDLGVQLLSVGLGSSKCRLEKLRLSGCGVTEEGCASLASVLRSNPSHLRELDLSYNQPGESGVRLLSQRLEDPECKLEKLNVDHDDEHWVNPQLLNKYACELTLDSNTVNEHLLLSDDNRRVKFTQEKQSYPDHPERFDVENQVLCREGLSGRCYWEVEWKGFVCIGVACKSIERKGYWKSNIEYNSKALCFSIRRWNGYSFLHNYKETFVPAPVIDVQAFLQRPMRLGVYLDWPAGILSFYWLSGDTKTLLHTFHDTFTEALYPAFNIITGSSVSLTKVPKLNMDNAQSSFTPEVLPGAVGISYRFRSPGPGVFHCALTGLVFNVSDEAEVLYRTVVWDETLLNSAGKEAAGPLFSIQCPQDSVRQLHLPHCEPTPALRSDCLFVVHITDDGMSILEPLEITETHVVVTVPHLSAFGLVWDLINKFQSFVVKPIGGQILLFLRPPDRKQRQILNVILLPSNVPLEEVRVQQEGAAYIQAPSYCHLTKGQSYSLYSDPEGFRIQPTRAPFDAEYGPNYHPTFQIVLLTSTEEITLMVQDQDKTPIWEHGLILTGACPDENLPRAAGASAAERLRCARTNFIERVSEPVLNKLLDELLQHMVINDEEMETARAKTRADKARDVIDMVRRKGTRASTNMISILSKDDPYLCKQLNLA